MICNFCGKTLSDIDEDVLGEQQIVFPYGSKRDGDRMRFVLCSDCIDKLNLLLAVSMSQKLFSSVRFCLLGKIKPQKKLITNFYITGGTYGR